MPAPRPPSAASWLFALLLGGASLGAPGLAQAEEPPVSEIAPAAEVRAALEAYARASRSKVAQERAEAVRTLARLIHERVTKRLLKTARREKHPAVLAATYDALARQRPFAASIVPKLATRLTAEAEAEGRRMARGTAEIHTDPRTGDPDLHSEAGRARLSVVQQQNEMRVALLAALDALGWEAGKRPPDLGPLLQSASDDLVVAVLAWMARNRIAAALPAVLDLFRMYPTAASWETGAVVDLGGTNASAKAKWMARFGHPDKQRARPDVHRAIHAFLESVTGRAFETPAALAAWLDSAGSRTGAARARGGQ